MALLAMSGRLGNDPKPGKTKNDKDMCSGFFFGDVENRSEEELSFPCNIMAFGYVAQSLARHEKGDFLTVSGRLQTNMYDGQQRFTIVADAIVSAKAARPKGGKAKSYSGKAQV